MSSYPAVDVRSRAEEKFQALITLFAGNNVPPAEQRTSFWKLGNAFDTVIDYLDTVDAGCARCAGRVVWATAVAQFNAALAALGGYDNLWFDDFGWWTVATQRALQRPYFRQHAASIQLVLDACWSRFTGNAPHVWARRAPGAFEDCGPAVQGGVWNEYWSGTSPEYHGPKDGDPRCTPPGPTRTGSRTP